MIQTVNINVAALPALRGPGAFMVLSQNENGRQIRFRILGSDLPTGCTATFSGTKPDGNVYSTTGTVSGNFVIVQEDIQMTAVAGIWDAKLEIAKGTENIVTSIIRVTVVRDPVAGDAIPSDSQLDGIVTEVKYYAEHARSEAYGSPLTAATKSQMTDHTRVYVYTGSEPNMVAGNWYHWNGTKWISGGVYNAVAVQTDTTLSVAGKAADGKATGDALNALKEDLSATIYYKTADIGQYNAQKNVGLNSAGRYGAKSNWVGGYYKDGIADNVPYYIPYIYAGSVITVNEGYKGAVALWDTQPVTSSVNVSHRLEWKGNIAAGSSYVFTHSGYLVFACAYSDEAEIGESVTPVEFVSSALSVELRVKTVKDKISVLDSDAGAVAELGTRATTGIDAVNECLVWADNIVPLNGIVSGILNDDETIGASATYNTSAYFPIKPNTTYTNRTSGTIAHFYDYAKRPVLILGISAKTFTTPANAVYARISSNVSTSRWQINEGDTLLDYTVGSLPYIDTGGESAEHSPYYHGPFDIMPCDFTEWYSGQQADYTAEGFARTSTYAEVITAFDALMALDTQYITKNTLGTASGTDADGNAYTLYEYVFQPKNYSSSINTKKVPKIYMDGSIHGFEKCSTFGLYFFLKDLIANWGKNHALEVIRRSVEIHVIPVSNPYGFDRNLYKNGNDVNINRNFDHPGDWIVVDSGSDQNGLAAFDQPESAIIRDWLLADEANMLCYMNLHTNGQWNASSLSEMNACMTSNDRRDTYFNRIFRVFCDHIEAQTLRWSEEYDSINPTSSQFCGKIQSAPTAESTKGTASAWADTMRSIVAMTLEGFNGINSDDTQIIEVFSANAYKINSENIGNMVIQMLKHYAE